MKIIGKCFHQNKLKTPAQTFGYHKEGSYIYNVNKAQSRKTKLKLNKGYGKFQNTKFSSRHGRST